MARSVRRPALGLATLSHDLRNLRESLCRFEREAFVAEDRVPLLVDLVRVHESLDDLIVRDAERARRRRRADGQERVPDFLPIAGMEVHHHDCPDAALLPVQGGLLRDPVEGVRELVLAPRRTPRGPGDRHRDPARHECLAHEPRTLFESRLDHRRVLGHEGRGTFTKRTPALKDALFATSIERSPGTPSAKSMFPLRILSSPSRTSFIVASGIKNSQERIFRAASSFSTVMPAIFIVVSSATIKARFPSFSDWQTSPTVCRASWPTTTFRGSSIAFDFEKDSVSIVDKCVSPKPASRNYLYLNPTTPFSASRLRRRPEALRSRISRASRCGESAAARFVRAPNRQ